MRDFNGQLFDGCCDGSTPQRFRAMEAAGFSACDLRDECEKCDMHGKHQEHEEG